MTPNFHHQSRIRKFRTQLTVWFVIVVLLPTIFIGLWYFSNSVRSIQSRRLDQLAQEAEKQGRLFDSRLESVEHAALSFIMNSTLQQYFSYSYPNAPSKIRDVLYSFRPLVKWLLTTNVEYERIHFFTVSPDVSYDSFVDPLEPYRDEEWMQKTLQSGLSGYWIASHDAFDLTYSNDLNRRVASYAMRFPLTADNVLLLDISTDWLYEGLSLVASLNTGEAIYSADYAVSENPLVWGQEKRGLATLELNGIQYYAYPIPYERLGITLFTLMSKKAIREETAEANAGFFAMALLSVALSMALVIIFSKSVTDRMQKIQHNVRRITQDEYIVHFDGRSGDEIDELGNDVTSLGQKMDYLVNQVLTQRMLAREAELHALQAQINPHFIFNMLETMRMMAEIEEKRELSDIISQFGRMVRYNLYSKESVSLRDELDNASDYVVLQNLMYNGELHLQMAVNPALSEIRVPRLMLQPIIENAILHGKRLDTVLRIRIDGALKGSGMTLCVSNNGKAIPPDKENALRSLLQRAATGRISLDSQKESLALLNVQRRLFILYGDHCVLHIAQSDGEVRVWFNIPRERIGEL